MQEAAETTFSSPPCFFLLPFYLPPSTPQGHCWPPHCGPAYALLWFCFKHGHSRLFKLTKSQGAPGFLRLCFAYTRFPCCTQEGVCYGAPSSTECFIPSFPSFGYCNILSCGLAENQSDTFGFFQNAAMKILSAPCCFDHIPLACFSYVVTSVSHIQNKHCAFSSRLFPWLNSNLNITSTATKIYFYSAMEPFPLNLDVWKPNKHWHAEKRHIHCWKTLSGHPINPSSCCNAKDRPHIRFQRVKKPLLTLWVSLKSTHVSPLAFIWWIFK